MKWVKVNDSYEYQDQVTKVFCQVSLHKGFYLASLMRKPTKIFVTKKGRIAQYKSLRSAQNNAIRATGNQKLMAQLGVHFE